MSKTGEVILLERKNLTDLVNPSFGTGNAQAVDPATGYLMSLKSHRSRLTMYSFLNKAAAFFANMDVVVKAGLSHRDKMVTLPWHLIDRYEFMAFIESMRNDGRSPNTVSTYVAAVKGVFKEARTQGLIDQDHYFRVKGVTQGRGTRSAKGRRLMPSEIEPLIKSCDTETVKGSRDAAMIAILLECGLRRSELVGLDISSLKGSTLKVLGKGDKERIAHLPPLSRKLLSIWINDYRGTEEGKIFLRVRTNDDIEFQRTAKIRGTGMYQKLPGGLSTQAVTFILESRATLAGVDKFSPHDLRRTLATTLFEHDVDTITIQKIMGHSDLATTERYDMRGDTNVKTVQYSFSYY